MSKIMTIGFIGNGKSTNRYHMPYLLQRKDNIKVKTIYSRQHKKHVWDDVPGVNYTEDLEELLGDPDIQVCVVATTAETHFELTKRVLLAGKNCVCEKPFTLATQEARDLFALAKEQGVMLQCYQNRRFDSDYLTVQKVMQSGKLGDLQEMEICFDYYRPKVPESSVFGGRESSFLYGHACHTLDQVIALFGKPERVSCDVRQLLGVGRMNDYFDLDLFYGNLKASVKSSYFRVKARPAITVYGRKGMFVKEIKDKQEEHLKLFYMPGKEGFGMDKPEEYGTLTYYDPDGEYHEEKVITITGDYGRYYDALYDTIMNGAEQLVKPEETITQIEIMERSINGLR